MGPSRVAGKKESIGNTQIPLAVALADHAVFESFLPAGNDLAVDRLRSIGSGESSGPVFVYGAQGCGKTHLLQATCAAIDARHGSALYLQLPKPEPGAGSEQGMKPEILDGLESFDLVCLDDLDAILGDSLWETAIFTLFNGLADNTGSLVVSANNAPAACGLRLPDLVSRLASGPVFRLASLDDAARIEALRLRALKRGFELPVDTAEFLMRRLPRDMHTLFQFLDRLDHESLAAQRRLTIPFVRQLIDFD